MYPGLYTLKQLLQFNLLNKLKVNRKWKFFPLYSQKIDSNFACKLLQSKSIPISCKVTQLKQKLKPSKMYLPSNDLMSIKQSNMLLFCTLECFLFPQIYNAQKHTQLLSLIMKGKLSDVVTLNNEV